jgi:acyl-CoA synthetase (AMP-forming)/AMP-acid ligase II
MPAEILVDQRPSISFSSIPDLLDYHAKRSPEAQAILAPGRAPLSYGRLYQHIEEVGRTLRAMEIGRRDRVAVVLPNGPEMAVAFLAVTSWAVCVPINPAYGTEELGRYFADLRPRALITQAGIDSPARRVALSRAVQVLELSVEPNVGAGIFTLTGERGPACPHDPAKADDVAELLLTSGTTSRPKIVPLTHANLCASAYSSIAALALRETDRCINVVPLFHGHGLHNVLLAAMAAGASVVCTPGCDVDKFFDWLSDFRPTWYSAVPTMHQAILAQARHIGIRPADHQLRFIRCSSASLPRDVSTGLEQIFQTPVIEFYGMTETASSPLACNPLPPRQRKLGSVGIPVDLDVAIMDEGGALLGRGQTGQVVVKGTAVTAGYDGDPGATKAAFAGDWFKTGDVGHFDDDGYLFLTSRVREMINRGGEKVTPQEVEAVLLQHPAVAEAVTFAVPHPTLGEDVASAIVLRPGVAATPNDIRQFATGRIADFKVPRQVVILKDIPKGPTGKVQRIGLAAKLGLASGTTAQRAYVAPRTLLESALAKRWGEILRVEQIGIHDDFFALGGDSLLASRVLSHVYDMTQIELEVSRFFEAPTVADVAQHLERLIDAGQASPSAIVRVPRENGVAPTSVEQDRLWELQQALDDVPFFNVLYALRLTSQCDAAVLERSINEIVRRHEMLRTTFAAVDDEYVQVIAPHLTVSLACDDLQGLSQSEKEPAIQRLLNYEALHPFDLANGPLIRARLVRLGEQTHLLLIAMHGIIQDGWSLGVLVGELVTLYDAFAAGRPSPLPPLPIQFADFAHWQRHWWSYPDIAAQLSYWREQLREPLPVLKLAPDSRRRNTHDFKTAQRKVMLPAKLSEAAKEFSQREGVTLFMTLIAAFKTLLHRHTGEDDLRVATHLANRNRPGTEGLIGPLVNTVVLRTSLDGDPSSREVMRRVRATTLAAYANQDLPFEEVVSTLEHERGVEPAALAQVLIWLQNAALRPIMGAGQGLSFEEVDPAMLTHPATVTAFDIMLMLREGTQGLIGTCVYKPHLFAAETIDRMLAGLQQVLEHMVVDGTTHIGNSRLIRTTRMRRIIALAKQ